MNMVVPESSNSSLDVREYYESCKTKGERSAHQLLGEEGWPSSASHGFIYISSVIDDDNNKTASTRSGLRQLYREATSASKLLVMSRLSNEKVLPWIVSSSGAIRCFDTVSLSHKLSLHRHALRPILIHLFMWDRTLPLPNEGIAGWRSSSPPPLLTQHPRLPSGASGPRLDGDTVGDLSFRFNDFSLGDNWV